MKKVNLYLIQLSTKYIFINLFIISLFILFLNLIELSRLLKDGENTLLNYIILSILKFPSILNQIIPFVTIIGIAFLIRNLINNNEIPGAVVAISRYGKIAFIKAYGMQDVEKNTKMNLNSIFRIYSMTKPVVSVGAMILNERGEIYLDEPLTKYIPDGYWEESHVKS